MKFLAIIFILVAGMVWAEEPSFMAKCSSSSGCSATIHPDYVLCDNGAGALVKCPPTECQGVKVYEVKNTRNSVCMQCDRYICEGNGYEGEECYDSCSFSNSRYEQLKKLFKK